MKRLVWLFFVLLLSTETFSQNFWVPDSVFRHDLKQHYPSCFTANDSLITTCIAIKTETILFVRFRNIASFEGLQFFTSLEFFDCQENNLTQLPTLPATLKFLAINDNHISNLPDSLPPFLEVFHCYNNLIGTFPTFPNTLNALLCRNNLLTNLPPLPNGMIFLHCNKNHLTSLPLLPDSLKYLQCDSNQLGNLPSLPAKLNALHCNNNPLFCLPSLPSGLFELDFRNTFITCIPNVPSSLNSLPTNPIICSPQTRYCRYLNLDGFVFNDMNGNGLYDSLENGLIAKINYTGNNAIYSDSSGYFIAVCDTGIFTFDVVVPKYYSCTNNPQQTINMSGSNIQSIYFGLQAIPNVADLELKMELNGFARPGFRATYNIEYENVGTMPILNAQVKFLKPIQFANISANRPFNSNGDTLFWSIGNLYPNQMGTIIITDSVFANSSIGTPITAQSWITSVYNDTTPNNNFCSNHSIIIGSFDPNQKTVNPEFVSPEMQDYLEYIIRFQNTGTDTAFSVLITDSLSNYLDAVSLDNISASHQNSCTVYNGIAKWNFSNILLLDSNHNEKESHGFIKFRIKQKANLTLGTHIPNYANIYFDYNTPVVTNTINVTVTAVMIKENGNDFINLFPIPVQQIVHLIRKDKDLGTVSLIDGRGILIEKKIINSPTFEWNIEQLNSGIFIFTGDDWKQKIIKK